MPTTQENRLLKIDIPSMDKDHLLLSRIEVTEGMSQLFAIEAGLLHAEEETHPTAPTIVDPKDILGASVTITVNTPEGTIRHMNGVVNRFVQGIRDRRFTYYQATIVPRTWLLTKRIRSQIFQQKTVREILERIFKDYEGLDVKFELQRTYEQRNYCVQYRETDFAFISRLMEEEGIYYFFVHSEEKEKLVIADTPQSHPVCPGKDALPFHMKYAEEGYVDTIREFVKNYKLLSGKVTHWDVNFQLPGKSLDKQEMSRYPYGDSKKLEVYDFPGGYAVKYDGISTGGRDQNAELQKVFADRDATVKHCMEGIDSEVETSAGLGECPTMTPGHKFTLSGHPNEALNKSYVITSVRHSAKQSPDYVSTDTVPDPYVNEFTCIGVGSGMPCFRPPHNTPKPVINSSQTAFVVGPKGEEIHVDKYGRVKVQFHWDRDGKMDAASSCWVRSAQVLAGNNFGGMYIPRIGMEVLVHFLEGNPDDPIITGCVYNPLAMPSYELPKEKTKSGIKTNSTPDKKGFNELRFEDLKDKEQVFVHGERDMDIRIKNDRRDWTGNDNHLWVKRDRFDKVVNDEHHLVERHQYQEIKKDRHLKVGSNENIEVTGSRSLKITGNFGEGVTGNKSEEIGGTFLIKGSTVVIDGTSGVTLKCGSSFVTVNGGGVHISGPIVNINSGGAALAAPAIGITAPTPPKGFKEADDAKPGTITKLQKESDESKGEKTGKEDEEKLSWIIVKLLNEADEPVRGEAVKIKAPDGKWYSGSTNQDGICHIKGIDPGSCEIRFPNLDKDAWEE